MNETWFEYLLRRTRNIPASIRRRRRVRALKRRIAAERVEVSAAELQRRRDVVDRFLADQPGPTMAQTPATADPAVLSLPTSDDPVVTVIIPTHDAIDDLMQCLRSFERHPPVVAFEVIVANDCSDEDGFAPVREVGGLTIIDNETNLGFLQNCNQAAAMANGSMLWFLNSDTELRPGSLDALVATFDDFPDAAIVGSKLLNSDGTLQEAGGIVWRDGSAWNYGRGSAPDDPRVDYARCVDYVSGASLLVDRVFFEAIGRFDTAFAPAYYEDTDLGMQAREHGRTVVYQPLSEVIHHEGGSMGVDPDDPTSGKHHQVLNHETFYRKWHRHLAAHRDNADEPEREKERDVSRRALVIDARMLTPDMDSGSLRMANIVRSLQANGHKVTFVPANRKGDEPYAERLRATGVEVMAGEHAGPVETLLRDRGTEFDVAVLSRLEVASEFLSEVKRRCPNALVVYDTVDLHFLRELRRSRLEGGDDPAGADELRDRELACIERSDLALVCSSAEQDLLAELVPDAAIALVGNIHDPEPTVTPAAARADLLFVGGFEHPPNLDAVEWFVHTVLPDLAVHRPDIHLHVVGSRAPDHLHDLAGPNVTVHGYVRDLRPLYESCRIAIAPLRYGAGVKGKVTEALSARVACVATTMAAEGSGFVAGEHLVVADTSEDFVAECLRLLEDDELWTRIADGGHRRAAELFGFDAASRHLGQLLSIPARPR